MDTESYKTRTQNVRRAARAHLADLRRARRSALARSDGTAKSAAPPDLAPETLDDAAPPEEISNVALAEMVEGGPAADQSASSDFTASDAPDGVADEAEHLLDSMDVEETASDDSESEVSLPEEAAPDAPPYGDSGVDDVALADDGLVVDPASPAPDPASDLACLPGAGPGLIWMLNACDVHSLSDLAAEDPAELTEKLGVVGQIINVEHWVTLAKAGPRSD